MYACSVSHHYNEILSSIESQNIDLSKPQRKNLALLTACMLSEKTPNLMVLAQALPLEIIDIKHRYQYVSRVLCNRQICPKIVMSGFLVEIIKKLRQSQKTIILMMDQSKISDGFECLMVSIRVANRAIPVAWQVIETKGNIGFNVQKELLDEVVKMLPNDLEIMFSADRFYGTSMLVNWCQKQGWGYRIRLKGNNIFHQDDGEITGNDAAKMKITSLENATFNDTKITTNIGILHEKRHPEPWIIAMDCPPNKYKVLDYGLRWGIECMFSDFKSRGFNITKTHLEHTDRIEKMILIMTIAMIFAVSAGMSDKSEITGSKKNVNAQNFHASQEG